MPKKFISLLATLIAILLSTNTAEAAAHHIQVRQAADGTGGEFYDTRSGRSFIPRGVNHMPLQNVTRPDPERPNGLTWSFFAVGKYSQASATEFLNNMTGYGYNTVRVFIANDLVGNIPGPGLDDGYMDNLTNFLSLAKTKEVYLLPVVNGFPWGATYWPTLTSQELTQMSDTNAHFLNQKFIDARKQYLQDFIRALQNRNAATEYILGYGLENEFFYDMKSKPFTLTSGSITTAAGNFDIGNINTRQQLMDANMVNYTNQLTSAIKLVDPTALVTMGFFHPNADDENKELDTYWIFADRSQGGSTLDFVDLHIYPFFGSVENHWNAFRINSRKKPILIGEFGADKGTYPDINRAVETLINIQSESCARNVRGWLLFSWGASDVLYYSGEEQNAVINKGLAPFNRNNPCSSAVTESLPFGRLDRVESGGKVVGWAFDRNASAIDVHFYLNAPSGQGGTLVGSTRTSVNRLDVYNSYGHGLNSGFIFQVPLNYLSDGLAHKIYAYAINKTTNGSVGENPQLNNNGLDVIYNPAPQTATPVPATPTPIPTVPGDLTGDGHVNNDDVTRLRNNFGNPYTIFDYNKIVANYGR